MQRIRSIWCNPLWASWLLAILAFGFSNSGAVAQELGFQSPPLAPIFEPVAPAPPAGQERSQTSGTPPIFDAQVQPTDFQATTANAAGLNPNLSATATLPLSATSPPANVLPPTDNNPPLANAIREYIEPDADKPEERTSASLFQLSALQLDNLDWKKMVLSLGVVVGGYLALMLLLRLWNPQGSSALPREVVEVLGTTPLNSRQSLQLVRLGSKLLLLIHSPEGTQSLGEISNPNEVEHLAQICCQRRGRKGPTAFRKFSENPSRDPQAAPPLDALLKNLQLALQRTPGRTEYEA
jgi:flagellar biogenesis protein FliO